MCVKETALTLICNTFVIVHMSGITAKRKSVYLYILNMLLIFFYFVGEYAFIQGYI